MLRIFRIFAPESGDVMLVGCHSKKTPLLVFRHLAFEDFSIRCSKTFHFTEQIVFSHRSTCTFFFQKTGIFPPKFLLLTGFLSTLFGWLGCCLSSRSSRYKIWIRKTGRSQPTGDQDQTPLLHKYPTCCWSEMQKQTGEKSDRAKREGARWPGATLYRGVMGVFRLG